MAIQAFAYQYRQGTRLVDPETGILVRDGIDLIRALYNRTGQGTGIPLTVGNNLTALGTTQAGALELINDLNEVLNVSAGNTGVRLLSTLGTLKPTQAQWVYNGTGSGINVFPPSGGQIDSLGTNNAYSLANGKQQIFTCWGLLASGVPYFRSLQLG